MTALSTSATSGTERLDRIIGAASAQTRLWVGACCQAVNNMKGSRTAAHDTSREYGAQPSDGAGTCSTPLPMMQGATSGSVNQPAQQPEPQKQIDHPSDDRATEEGAKGADQQ